MVEQREIGRRQPLAMAAHALVDRMQIEQHAKRRGTEFLRNFNTESRCARDTHSVGTSSFVA